MTSLTQLLEEERQRSTRYFERMKNAESNLADIRKTLGVSNRPQRFTMQRIADLIETEGDFADMFAGSVGEKGL